EPMRIEIAASDAGTLPVNDISLLPSGRLVAAFGEAGVKLLARDGRTITHFDQPAHRLVISDHGDRAIVMARRGEVWRLARLIFSHEAQKTGARLALMRSQLIMMVQPGSLVRAEKGGTETFMRL